MSLEPSRSLTKKNWMAVKDKLDDFIQHFNERLVSLKETSVQSTIALAIGESIYEFEGMGLFENGNGRLARLLANYIATYCGIPPIVFDQNYHSAIRDKREMVLLIAQKMKEAVYDQFGRIFYLEKEFTNAGFYRLPGTDSTRLVELHELNNIKFA